MTSAPPDPPPAAPAAPAGQGRRRAATVLALAVALGLVSTLIREGPATPWGRALIETLVSGQRVGDLGRLRISGVQGDPWTDFSVARIEIRDRQGAWFTARNIAVRWRPWALILRRRIEIRTLVVTNIGLSRQPILLASRPDQGGASPVSLRIDRLAADVDMSEAFALRKSAYRIAGALDVARRRGLSGRIDAAGLSHPGDYLKAGFVFDRRRLDLEAHAREAVGGALAGSLGLDPRQPFVLDARAHGTPRSGWFALTSAVGARVPATAQGRWTPDGGTATATADLAASRWLAPWRDRLGPTANFTLAGRRAGGDLYNADLTAHGAAFALAAAGEVDPGRRRTGPAGVALDVRLADVSALAAIPGLGSGRLTGRVTGDPGQWRLLGEARLQAVRQAGYALASLDGPIDLKVSPGGLTLRAQARGAGGAGSGAAAVLLGAAPRAAADIDWLADGRVLLRRLSIQGYTLDLDGQGERGLLGGLSFKGGARIHDLARAAPGAQGLILADWRADQRSAAAPWIFSLSAKGQGLRAGAANTTIAETLLGAAPVFKTRGRLGREGLTIDQAALAGAAGGMTGAGSVSAGGELRLRFEGQTNAPLRLGPVLSSGVRLTGAVTGALDKPRLDGLVDVETLSLDGLPGGALRRARLALTADGEAGAISGRAGFAAADSQGPVTAAGAFRLAGRRVELSDLDVSGLGGAARGSAAFENGSPAQADLTVSMGPGALFQRGHASGMARITGPLEARQVSLAIQGSELTLPGGGGDLDALTFTAAGPWRRLPYRIDFKGNLAGALAKVSGSGVLSGGAGLAEASFSGGGRLGTADVSTVSPAALSWRRGDLEGDLNLAVGQGRARVTVTRKAGGLSGRAVVTGLDLGLLDADVRGRADGVLTLARQGGSLLGDAKARVSGLSTRDSGGAAAFDGDLTAAFGGGAVALGGRLSDGHGSTLSGDVRLPATLSVRPLKLEIDTRRPLSGRFEIDGDVGPIWEFLGGGGQSLTGRLIAKGDIGGTVADPRLTGAARVENGDFEDGGLGLSLRTLSVRAAFLGDAVDVAAFSASDGAKGSMTGSGRLSLVRDGASSFRLNLSDFRLIDTPLGQAAASGVATVDRAADGKVRLGGALTIDHALISPRAAAPSGVVSMEVVEIHGPADAAPAAAAAPDRTPPLTLDVGLKAPGAILIKGRGLNLEMSLDARVTGTSAAPVLAGVARVVRGDYDFAGQRFQVQDGGAVYLGSTPETIRLDLTASRDDPTLTAVIKIGGTAAAPTLTLSSTPPLPKDEILSQVLFGASAAQLSGLQAAQLASAVAGLAGGGGLDVIGGLRTFAHLDRLAFDTAATGVTVAGGKYISNKVYVELTNGTRTGQGAQVEWRLKKHLSVVSRVTSQGDNAVSLRWRKDY